MHRVEELADRPEGGRPARTHPFASLIPLPEVLGQVYNVGAGSRRGEGTKTRLTLASLLQTWSARNLNPFIECLTALQRPTAAAPP